MLLKTVQTAIPGHRGNPLRKPVDEILKFLRKPEQSLINSYYNSTIRSKLRERFDWYNDIEGEQNVGNTLENVYGGTYNPLRTTAHFIRNNILVSLVLIAVSGQLVSNYLSTPTENRYSDTRQVVKTEESGLQTPPAVADVAGARDRLHDMNHCAVSNDLRQVYENVESRTVKEDVLTEIAGFITAYSQSDLENWFATRARKREVTISHIQSDPATDTALQNPGNGGSYPIDAKVQQYRLQYGPRRPHHDKRRQPVNKIANPSAQTGNPDAI